MRVLQINQYCGFGSTGKIVQELHDLIIENGHECCIAYGRYQADETRYNTYKIGGKLNNYLHVLETRLLDNHGFGSRLATRKFIKFIEEYNPDVIHIHNLHGYYVNIEILMNYLKKRGTKIIWTFHDSWNYSAHTATLDYYNGMLPDCIQNRNELREYPRAYFSPFNNYYRKKKIFSDFNQLILVSPSNWLSKMVENSFFSAYPCITINNGIDLEVFYPEKNIVLIESNGLQDKKIYLFVASVWSEKKGVKYLNELADLVDSKKEKIVAIGKLDKGISLNHQILHINQTEDQSELRSWYSNADVFVNPTLSEVFGMTNVESQACGTPVVSFDTGGSPESIVEGTGLVVEKGDLSQLLRAIRDLENVSVEKCVRNARRFEAERCFEKYLSLYEER